MDKELLNKYSKKAKKILNGSLGGIKKVKPFGIPIIAIRKLLRNK